MSGFLLRLSARSLGLAPVARPRAALPYAAPAADTPPPAAFEPATVSRTNPEFPPAPAAWPSLSKDSRPPSPPTAVAADGQPAMRADRDQPAYRDARPALEGIPPDQALPPQASGSQAPLEKPAAIPNRRTAPTPPPIAALPYGRSPEPAAALPSTAADASGDDRLMELETLVSRLLLVPATDHPVPSAEPPLPSTTDAPPPSGLRPDAFPSIRPQAARNDLASAGRTASDTAPEVHITIGRLEVNPPSRPTPPPPRPRGPAPLSLGDYLARRAGGRS